MFSEFGKRKKIQDIEQHLIQSTKILAYLIPVIIGISYIIIPVFINYFLPAYVESIFVIKVLLLATFFVSLMHAPTYYLIAVNKQGKLVLLSIISLLLVVLFDFVAIKQNLGIKGVAIATSASYFIYITLLLTLALNEQKNAFKKKLLFFVNIYLPFVYSCLILVILDMLIKAYSNVLVNDIFFTILKTTIFILFSLPLLIYINKTTKIIDHLWSIIRLKSHTIKVPVIK
jgi:O-antigen/teichoic acid export membrane protein